MYEIDLHNMTAAEAKRALDTYINQAPKGAITITVIHGYNQGTALQKFVRKDYKHKRLDRRILTLNQGMTELILK